MRKSYFIISCHTYRKLCITFMQVSVINQFLDSTIWHLNSYTYTTFAIFTMEAWIISTVCLNKRLCGLATKKYSETISCLVSAYKTPNLRFYFRHSVGSTIFIAQRQLVRLFSEYNKDVSGVMFFRNENVKI